MRKRKRNVRNGGKAVPKGAPAKLAKQPVPRRKPAVDKAKAKPDLGVQYKSGLERRFAATCHDLGVDFEYETETFAYQVPPQKYTPDFKIGPKTFVETKGKFTDADRKKMLAVLSQNPDIKLVMVFSNPNTKVRKGAKLSYKEWCEKKGIACAGIDEFEVYLKEKYAPKV